MGDGMLVKNDKSSFVREIQTFLLKIGYGEIYLVPIDGVWSENTHQAIRAFQRENNISATGTVDFTTYQMLKEASEAKMMD